MENIIKLNREWFDSVFESLKPWSVSSGPSHKSVWVRCYGLPLSFWNRNCFSKVIGVLAPSTTLISIDHSSELWENVEYARLHVRILKFESVRMAKCVRVNNLLCNIFIDEKIPVFYESRCKDNHCSIESSDSVSSSETYIEETEFVVNNGEEENRLWEGEEHRSKREEEGELRVEDDEQYPPKTNFPFEDLLRKAKIVSGKMLKP